MNSSAKTLRELVEEVCPKWESWYPNLLAAAEDLGVARARVQDPSELLLSNRGRRATTGPREENDE